MWMEGIEFGESLEWGGRKRKGREGKSGKEVGCKVEKVRRKVEERAGREELERGGREWGARS